MAEIHDINLTWWLSNPEMRERSAVAWGKFLADIGREINWAVTMGDRRRAQALNSLLMYVLSDGCDEMFVNAARGYFSAWCQPDLKYVINLFNENKDALAQDKEEFGGEYLASVLNPLMQGLQQAVEPVRLLAQEMFPTSEALDAEAHRMAEAGIDPGAENVMVMNLMPKFKPCEVCGEKITYDEWDVPLHAHCRLHHTDHDKCDPDDDHIPGRREAIVKAEKAKRDAMPGYI